MSDEDNIIEIDFDEELLATEVDDVSLPAMDKSNSPTLHVGILGNNEISNSLEVCLGHPYKYSPITFTKYNDVDSCISDTFSWLPFAETCYYQLCSSLNILMLTAKT